MSTVLAFVVVVAVGAATALSVITAITSSPPDRRPRSGRSADLRWHLVLRCHNGADTIGETLDHLATAFPEADLWVADECSDDGTPEVVERLGAENPRIHLVRIGRAQLGRGSGYVLHSIYWAVSRAIGPDADRDRTILGLLHPVTRLSSDALDVLADRPNFGYASVGAVQLGVHRGGRRVRTPFPELSAWRNFVGRAVFRVQDIELRGPIPAAQLRRHRSGSAELGATGQFVRLAALDDVADRYGTAWPEEAEDGGEQTSRLLLAGWRTAYTDQAWVTEVGRWSLSAYVEERSQAMVRALRTSRHLPEVLRATALTTRARCHLACSLLRPWGALLGTLLFLAPPALLAAGLALSPAGTLGFLASGGWAAVVTFLVIAFVELACWGALYGHRVDSRAGILRGLGWGLAHVALVPAQYAACWRGLLRARKGATATEPADARPARRSRARTAPRRGSQRELTVDRTAPAVPGPGRRRVGEAVTEAVAEVWPVAPPQPALVRSSGQRVVRARSGGGVPEESGWTEWPEHVTPARPTGRRVSHRR